jgi:hypothetical protein
MPGRDVPGYFLHEDTRQLCERLIATRRVLRVYKIDEWGVAWIRCRFKMRDGTWEHHDLSVNEDIWDRVPRKM